MCGIAGFFDQDQTHHASTLRRMLNAQAHRGPDAEGYFFERIQDNQVALGHRRLSILDVSSKANQPMHYEQLSIIYNGEVYNFVAIKKELEQLGYTFNTDGDTEVILKAFHCWHLEAIKKFRGMFSFCIVDKAQQKVYLVRDRVGTKPLYYYQQHKTFIFSSEIRSLQYHPHFKSTLSDHGMDLFFQYGYIPSPFTILENTKKISPGHYLEYDLKTHRVIEKSYWDLATYYHLPKLTLPEEEATDQLHQLLIDAFTLRLVSDVPVGVLLSGGIDSSLIAAILQAQSSQPLETFTMAFHHATYDESSHARAIARQLGTHHHEKLCTWHDAEQVIAQFPTMYGEPLADISAIPTALLSQFTRQRVTVALSGDGGDELFCGYQHYLLSEKRFNQINKIPFKQGFSKLLNSLPDPMMRLYGINYDKYNRYLKLKSILAHDHIEEKYNAISRTYTAYDLNKLFLNQKSLSTTKPIYAALDGLERMMLMDFNYYLSDNLMVKVDRATMFYSLEGREPLLDHTILEFAAQLPMQFKLKKRILKNILNQYVPLAYFDRQKHGFGVPINQWLRSELNSLVRRYLDPIKLKRQGLFNVAYINALKKYFLASKTDDTRIWTLLVFQMWYEDYFNETF